MIVAKINLDIMPIGCKYCRFCYTNCDFFDIDKVYRSCLLNCKSIENEEKIPDWCPLIEVKDENLQ